jgi:hypothetical protein
MFNEMLVEKSTPKMHMEAQKTLSSQRNPEQKEQSQKHQIRCQNILQSYHNQTSLLLA